MGELELMNASLLPACLSLTSLCAPLQLLSSFPMNIFSTGGGLSAKSKPSLKLNFTAY